MYTKHISGELGGRHSENLKIILKIHAFIPRKDKAGVFGPPAKGVRRK